MSHDGRYILCAGCGIETQPVTDANIWGGPEYTIWTDDEELVYCGTCWEKIEREAAQAGS